MDHAVAAFVRAMPPPRRQELRELMHVAQAHEGFDDAGEDDDADEDEDGFNPDIPVSAGPPPLPAMSHEDASRTADAVMLAAMRHAGADVTQGASRLSRLLLDAPERRSMGHLVRLSEVAPERVRWLSPGRLAAGKLTVLDGDPGLGKSALLCELAARLTRGQALPGGQPGPPRTVILMSAEDDRHDTIRPRLDAAGGDPARVVCFATVPDGSTSGRFFGIPGDVPFLELVIERTEAALVIIDPLVAFLDRGLSAHQDQDVRRALAVLQDVGARTGAAIVVVRHLNKSSATNPLYRGGGSIGIIGAARCGLLLTADPGDPDRRILAVSKGNLARPPVSLAFRLHSVPGADVARIVWEGESRWTAGELLRATAEREQTSAVGEVRTWLREALASGPRSATDMRAEAAAHGFSPAALKRARRAEGIVTRKARTLNGGWTWTLPGDDGEGAHRSPVSAS